MPFVKLDCAIKDSTIWDQTAETRVLWITMLTMADPDGYVGASITGLAHAARISVEQVERGLTYLSEPDQYSRDPSNDGRRIEKVDRGWTILNFRKHWERREKENPERRRERDRERMREWREKNSKDSNSVAQCHTLSHDVTKSRLDGDGDGDGDGERDRRVEKEKKKKKQAQETNPALVIPSEAWSLARLHRRLLLKHDPKSSAGGKSWSEKRWAEEHDRRQRTEAAEPIPWSEIEEALRWALDTDGDEYWRSRCTTPGNFWRAWDTIRGQMAKRTATRDPMEGLKWA